MPDVEAGELVSTAEQQQQLQQPPHLRSVKSGWDQKPSPWDGRAANINRTSSLPSGGNRSGIDDSFLPSPGLPFSPSAPPLHRSVSHPVHRANSPGRSSSNGPLPNGNAGHRANSGGKHATLPHHLHTPQGRSMPPGIVSKWEAAVDLPQAPPLLDASALEPPLTYDSRSLPAAKVEEPSPCLPGSDMLPPGLWQDAEPGEAAEAMTPAGLGATDVAITPASEDPPKRRRLGWGQGLARLRSVDQSLDPSPKAADSEASKLQAEAALDSAFNSPAGSLPAEDVLRLRSALNSPTGSLMSPLGPAQRKDSSSMATEPDSVPSLEGPLQTPVPTPSAAADTAATAEASPLAVDLLAAPESKDVQQPQLDTPAKASAPAKSMPAQQLDGSEIAVPSPAPPHKAAAEAAIAAEDSRPEAATIEADPAASPADMEPAVEAQEDPSSALPDQEQQPQQQHQQQQKQAPSKDAIMRRIDTLDAQIEVLEARLAGAGQAAEMVIQKEKELQEKMADLQRPIEMEVAETSEDEESQHAYQVD